LDARDGVVIYEAVVGRRAQPPLSEAELQRLARALAPLHAQGLSHGAVAAALVMAEAGPTLQVAGRSPTQRTPDDDLEELMRLGRPRAAPH
jgi:hypothetical protein